MRAVRDIHENLSNQCEVTVYNALTNKLRTIVIAEYTVEQFHDAYQRWRKGELIQNVVPMLSATTREMLISGMTPEEQYAFFKDDKK